MHVPVTGQGKARAQAQGRVQGQGRAMGLGLAQPGWLHAYEALLRHKAKRAVGGSGGAWARDRSSTGADSAVELTYGEVSTLGGVLIFERLRHLPGGLASTDVIYDLGSGGGRLVLLWALALHALHGSASGGMAVGVEVDRHRATVAATLFDRAKAMGVVVAPGAPPPPRSERGGGAARCELRRGDAFEEGAFADATHVYMCSTTWPDHMFELFLAAAAQNVAQAQARAQAQAPDPVLRWVLSTRAIPDELLHAYNRNATAAGAGGGSEARPRPVLLLYGTMVVPTSWTPECRVHIYRHAHAGASGS